MSCKENTWAVFIKEEIEESKEELYSNITNDGFIIQNEESKEKEEIINFNNCNLKLEEIKTEECFIDDVSILVNSEEHQGNKNSKLDFICEKPENPEQSPGDMSKRLLADEIARQLVADCNSDDESNSSSETSSIFDDSDNDPSIFVPENHNHETSSNSGSEDEVSQEIRSSNYLDESNWSKVASNFIPRFHIPVAENGVVLANIDRSSTMLDIFLKLFPRSLFIFISQCTNERLEQFGIKKNLTISKTDVGEIMIVLGCSLIMCYNRLPEISLYWSNHPSIGNQAIKNAISRDRAKLILSNLYFNHPKKPDEASKTHCIDEVINCMKTTFLACRSESSRQSIDVAMIKFKGRSTLKQYLPMKPIKRGVKVWYRCDAFTGYIYDFNIYSGKSLESNVGTLGERVVTKLADTIRSRDVTLCFDRYFSTVNLFDTLAFPAVGTYLSYRKNTPKLEERLEKGSALFRQNGAGTIAIKWKDTKDVFVMSNCHTNSISTTLRKTKDGKKADVPCPEAIIFYNNIMGGVDRAGRMSTQYDYDRKSAKWWKGVFFRLLLTSATNAWVLHNDLHHKETRFLPLLIELADQLIAKGGSESANKRSSSTGHTSKRKRYMTNVGDHLPVEGNNRRRCIRCSERKIEKRTKTLCQACEVPLCKHCFTPYHV